MVSDDEINRIVDFVKWNFKEIVYSKDTIESISQYNKSDVEILEFEDDDYADPFLDEAIEMTIQTGQASTSFIQRSFKVGYARAGRIIDQMEERGIISGYQGSKPREVLISREKWEELKNYDKDVINKEEKEEQDDKKPYADDIDNKVHNIEINAEETVIDTNNSAQIKTNIFFKIILWILLFPIMLIMYVIKSDTFADWLKVCLVITILLIFIVKFF